MDSSRLNNIGCISGRFCIQPFSKAQYIILAKAEAFVESDSGLIVCTYLNINLRAADAPESESCFFNQQLAKPSGLQLRFNPEVIEPAAMTVKTRHNSASNSSVMFEYKEEVGLD